MPLVLHGLTSDAIPVVFFFTFVLYTDETFSKVKITAKTQNKMPGSPFANLAVKENLQTGLEIETS